MKAMIRMRVATTSGKCVGVLMNECLTCGTSFLAPQVAIDWWQHSYCSQKCAEEDAKKIQEEEAAEAAMKSSNDEDEKLAAAQTLRNQVRPTTFTLAALIFGVT
jgi:hypothetical protein